MDNAGSRAPPVQGGFLLVEPSETVYEEMASIVREGDFRPSTGWGGSNIGWCWGGQTIQGLFTYYYNKWAPEHYAKKGLPPPKHVEIDPCVHNNMWQNIKAPRPKHSPTVFYAKCKDINTAEVKSAHFTICQKPWACRGAHGVCGFMTDRWWAMRDLFCDAWGLEKEVRTAVGRHHSRCRGRGYRFLNIA